MTVTPANTQIYNQSFLYKQGLGISKASNTTLLIASGQCRDESNTIDIPIASAITLNAAINGVNGLDTGTFAASTVYYIFAIGNSANDYSPGAILMSTSRTSPVLPTGYDSQRRIGTWMSDGSTHFYLMYQSGSAGAIVQVYDAPVAVASGSPVTSASYVNVDVAGTVPFIDGSTILVNVAHTPAGTGAAHGAFIAPGTTSTTTTYWTISGQVNNVLLNANDVPVLVNVSTTHLYFQAKVGNSSDSCAFTVKGFIDQL